MGAINKEIRIKCLKYAIWAAKRWGLEHKGKVGVVFEAGRSRQTGEPDNQTLAWVSSDDWDVHINTLLAKHFPEAEDDYWKNMWNQITHEVGRLRQRK